jgi:hypothetical protein
MAFLMGYVLCARRGDIEEVANILWSHHENADGATTLSSESRMLPFLQAVLYNQLPLVKFLLNGGGPLTTALEKTRVAKALVVSAKKGYYEILQWLLQEGGGILVAEVWDVFRLDPDCSQDVTSLLRVMLLLGEPTRRFSVHALYKPIFKQGQLIRMYLSTFLVQQKQKITAYCPLPSVLSSMIVAYATLKPEDDTVWAEDMRLDLLRIEVQTYNKSCFSDRRSLKRVRSNDDGGHHEVSPK